MSRAAARIPRRARTRVAMHQAPAARRQGSPAMLTPLTAQTRAAAEGPRQRFRAALPHPSPRVQHPRLPWQEGQRATRGQGWAAYPRGFRLSLQPGKQKAVRRGQDGAKQALPASRCQMVINEQEPASPCYSSDVPRGFPHKAVHRSRAYLWLSEPRPPQQRYAGWDAGTAGQDGPTRASQPGPSPQERPEGWVQADTWGADTGYQGT